MTIKEMVYNNTKQLKGVNVEEKLFNAIFINNKHKFTFDNIKISSDIPIGDNELAIRTAVYVKFDELQCEYKVLS